MPAESAAELTAKVARELAQIVLHEIEEGAPIALSDEAFDWIEERRKADELKGKPWKI